MFTATIQIRLVGTSPLMFCRITDAAMQQMINKSRSSIKVKESRDPRDIAGDLLYAIDGKPYLPKSNIRAAVIQAGTYIKVGKKQLTNKETSIIPSFFHITTERAMLVHPDDAKKPAHSAYSGAASASTCQTSLGPAAPTRPVARQASTTAATRRAAT